MFESQFEVRAQTTSKATCDRCPACACSLPSFRLWVWIGAADTTRLPIFQIIDRQQWQQQRMVATVTASTIHSGQQNVNVVRTFPLHGSFTPCTLRALPSLPPPTLSFFKLKEQINYKKCNLIWFCFMFLFSRSPFIRFASVEMSKHTKLENQTNSSCTESLLLEEFFFVFLSFFIRFDSVFVAKCTLPFVRLGTNRLHGFSGHRKLCLCFKIFASKWWQKDTHHIRASM